MNVYIMFLSEFQVGTQFCETRDTGEDRNSKNDREHLQNGGIIVRTSIKYL